jgi:hypothetical protein
LTSRTRRSSPPCESTREARHDPGGNGGGAVRARAVLASLETGPPAPAAVRALTDARAVGFCDVNLDLIYGARAETLASRRRSLNGAIG